MKWADYFYYDETSPTCLRWAVKKGPRAPKGGVAGYKHVRPEDGRELFYVGLDGKTYLVHRVIYELATGEEIGQGDEIDHIDGNATNNAIANLRVVTRAENAKNKRKYLNNTSGVTGVYRTTSGGRAIWVSSWNPYGNGKRETRGFAVSKYGEEGARALAIAKRDEEFAKLEGYTERHGI